MHPTSVRYGLLLMDLWQLHLRKSHDYAGLDNPLSNFERAEEMGIPTWKGILVRLSDKYSRLVSFARQEELEVNEESVEDTLIDLASYSLLCLLAFQGDDPEDNTLALYH